MEWLTAITQWLLDLVKIIWSSFVEFLNDFWIGVADTGLTAIAGTITAIPSPTFLQNYSMGMLFNQMPSELLYFLSFIPLGEGFSLLSVAVAFRLARKLLTLFQW